MPIYSFRRALSGATGGFCILSTSLFIGASCGFASTGPTNTFKIGKPVNLDIRKESKRKFADFLFRKRRKKIYIKLLKRNSAIGVLKGKLSDYTSEEIAAVDVYRDTPRIRFQEDVLAVFFTERGSRWGMEYVSQGAKTVTVKLKCYTNCDNEHIWTGGHGFFDYDTGKKEINKRRNQPPASNGMDIRFDSKGIEGERWDVMVEAVPLNGTSIALTSKAYEQISAEDAQAAQYVKEGLPFESDRTLLIKTAEGAYFKAQPTVIATKSVRQRYELIENHDPQPQESCVVGEGTSDITEAVALAEAQQDSRDKLAAELDCGYDFRETFEDWFCEEEPNPRLYICEDTRCGICN